MENRSFLHHKATDFAYEVDGAGGDDEAVGRGDGLGLGKGGGEVRGGLGGDVEGAGGGEEVFEVGGTGVVDRSEEDVVLGALGVSCGGVEEREEDLGHFGEVFVAEAAEEEGAGLGVWELGDGGAEGPGASGVVGYVEEEIWAFGEGEEFKAAGPFCVSNAYFDGFVRDFVTYVVTYSLVLE